ncbi:YhbY family RNA-binding protein [Candidatus Woesearchaeota archaeon]|nr:YhbY family RNA-binding protein [Candidatus Woesearchaeota archaeon]
MQKENIDIQVGKNGITPSLIEEIKKHLRAKKDVKVKFLKSFIGDKDRREVAENLNAQLPKKGKLIGNTLMIKN